MKKNNLFILISVLFFATFGVALAAPQSIRQPTLLPQADDAYDIGTSSLRWRNLYLSGTCTGCGGGAPSHWATSTTDVNAIIPAGATKVGIGSTSPAFNFGVAGAAYFGLTYQAVLGDSNIAVGADRCAGIFNQTPQDLSGWASGIGCGDKAFISQLGTGSNYYADILNLDSGRAGRFKGNGTTVDLGDGSFGLHVNGTSGSLPVYFEGQSVRMGANTGGYRLNVTTGSGMLGSAVFDGTQDVYINEDDSGYGAIYATNGTQTVNLVGAGGSASTGNSSFMGGSNVGIGTSTPYARLSVTSPTATSEGIVTNAILATSTTATSTFPVLFAGGSTPTTGGLKVYNDGKVRIGNSAPNNGTAPLSVESSSGTEVQLGQFNTTANTMRSEFLLSNSGTSNTWTTDFLSFMIHGASYAGNNYNFNGSTNEAGQAILLAQGGAIQGLNIGTYSNVASAANLSFFTNDATRLTIMGNSSGQVGYAGVGTTSPRAKLSVTATGATTGRAFAVANSSNVDQLLVLDNGFTGLGTTSPSSILSITSGSTIPNQIYVSSTTASAASSTLYAVDKGGWVHYGGATGILSTCGTGPSLDANSTDQAGTITFGATAGACTYTFANPPSTSPHCIISTRAVSLVNAYTVAQSVTSFTITQTASGGTVWDYFCPLGH